MPTPAAKSAGETMLEMMRAWQWRSCDPDKMPGTLRKAHAALDTAVDRLYRPAPFASDRDRVEHLFGRYEALVNPLERLGAAKNRRTARKAEALAEGSENA